MEDFCQQISHCGFIFDGYYYIDVMELNKIYVKSKTIR